MSSKEVRPKIRLGGSNPRRVKIITWMIGLLACGGGLFAAYRLTGTTEVEVATTPVVRGEFVISVRTRGDIKSAKSSILKAPPAPGLRIVRLMPNGSPVKRGDVVVAFDGMQQEQNVIQQNTSVASIQGDIRQQQATQRISQEADNMNKMQSEYSVESSKLDASKADVLSKIDGQKYRIQVGVAEGNLQQVKASINAHQVGNEADNVRQAQRLENAQHNLELATSYLGMMELRAPTDGVVTVLSNFRAQGTFGAGGQPPYKEGDNVFNGAEIAEIPELSQLFIDLKLEEVDRGKVQMGQTVKIRIDAIPDKEFEAKLDFISPIAALVFKGGSTAEKSFPARATLTNLDPRIRPGMSASAEIIIEKQSNILMIPIRSSIDKDGKPATYVQTSAKTFKLTPIEVGKRNDDHIVVLNGLKEGDIVTLETPEEAAKRSKKKM